MKQPTFYNQLGLYLLSKDTNVHPGACVCAAAGIYEFPETPVTTQRKIDEKIKLWFGEYLYNCVDKVFASATLSGIDPILTALGHTVDELHIVGHDIIQSNAALTSLHLLDNRAPEVLIDRIATHIKRSRKVHPSLFHAYSSEEIRREEARFDDYNADSTPSDVANSLVEILRSIKKSYFGFHFLSQETHLVTHAEAMISIYRLGYHDLFKRSLRGWFLRLKLLEIIHDLNLNATHKSPQKLDWDPRAVSFWDADRPYELYIHPVKTMCSYLRLKSYGLFSAKDIDFLEKKKLPYMADSRFPHDW